MMIRAFDNMVKNAVEAMPQGGQLTVRSEEFHGFVRIVFEDTGKGIAKENLEKMFTPLYTTKAKGMGLRLSICKRIVEAHKGSISVNSAVGEGTKFTIELPH
jgi:signal transduction histidine kinase